MAIAINIHWKIPVGYFAINGLNGERANLLTKFIILLSETNSHLHSITLKEITKRQGPTILK